MLLFTVKSEVNSKIAYIFPHYIHIEFNDLFHFERTYTGKNLRWHLTNEFKSWNKADLQWQHIIDKKLFFLDKWFSPLPDASHFHINIDLYFF